ncbi:MAG: XdhC family protein [Chloroflexota bacterium]
MTMTEVLPLLDAWTAAGVGAGRAVVVRVFGSAPRPEGAVLLVAADGRLAGSVSGGCVEGAAAEEIARARTDGHARVIRYGISDDLARSVGLACGGTIDVLVEPEVRPEVAAAARERGRAVCIPLPADAPGDAPGPVVAGAGEPPGAALVVGDDGTVAGATGDAATDAALVAAAGAALDRGRSALVVAGGRRWLVEAFPRPPRLVIVGAVQVAIPLVTFARTLGWRTVVIDGRSAFATRERFPDADEIVAAWPDEAADAIGLGPADSVAVLSHDVKFDEPAIVTALARGCRYVGAVGSRRTQADRRERLRAAGVADADLARLHGPIGLDLGGRAPAETALAILAEMVAARYGGSGSPLAERARAEAAGSEPALR